MKSQGNPYSREIAKIGDDLPHLAVKNPWLTVIGFEKSRTPGEYSADKLLIATLTVPYMIFWGTAPRGVIHQPWIGTFRLKLV